MKYAESLVNRPAKAVYPAMAAVKIPNAPPALVTLRMAVNSPAERRTKVTIRKKKRDERATEDLNVARKKIRVTTAHAAR